jgi:hypothetical protein
MRLWKREDVALLQSQSQVHVIAGHFWDVRVSQGCPAKKV